MSLDQELQPIDEPSPLTPARKRRARRSLILSSDEERTKQLEKLSRKAFPSFGTFFFSLIAGIVIGAGYLFDSQTILLLGVLIVPLLSPWVGLMLATVTGSLRFFIQTLIGLAISFGLIFGSSFLAGKISLSYPPLSNLQATMHSHIWWPDIGMVVLGSILMVAAFIRSEKRPIIPSVMLAYELILPLSIAGFGYGSGNQAYWPNGILVFSVYFSLATLIGLTTLFFVKLRPRKAGGCLMTIIIGLLALASFTWISGAYIYVQEYISIPWNIPAPPSREMKIIITQTSPESANILIPTSGRTSTAIIPIEQSSTPQPTPSPTPIDTITPEPTPIFAIIITQNNEGANVRANPEGEIIATLLDGTLVEILSGSQLVDGLTWINIRTTDNLEGWIIQDLITITTPTPGS